MSSSGTKLSRRNVFVGAATAGALGTAATLLPRTAQPPGTTPEAKPAPERGGGYRVTDHVLRYYDTTRT